MTTVILFVSGFLLIWAASRVFRELNLSVQDCRFLGTKQDVCEYRLVYGIWIAILLMASGASLTIASVLAT